MNTLAQYGAMGGVPPLHPTNAPYLVTSTSCNFQSPIGGKYYEPNVPNKPDYRSTPYQSTIP
ncbi:MAG: hypothetical protein ACOYMG_20190, partial [Candidatus Methylumidiphilus sp.]